jgi:nicotinamidase-related amidase
MRDRTASVLLVMDVQRDRRALRRRRPRGRPRRAALAAARAGGVRVVFVRVAFRPGHPEVSPRNRAFAAVRDAGGLADDATTAIDPRRRCRARSSSPSAASARSPAATSTSSCAPPRWASWCSAGSRRAGSCSRPLRAAADLDFGLTVLHDACADADEEVHRVLTTKVFPRQAEVLDVAAWPGCSSSSTTPTRSSPGRWRPVRRRRRPSPRSTGGVSAACATRSATTGRSGAP